MSEKHIKAYRSKSASAQYENGCLSFLSSSGFNLFYESSLKEKSDLDELNAKLAEFVAFAKQAEQESNYLSKEINKTQENWGKVSHSVRLDMTNELVDLESHLEKGEILRIKRQIRDNRQTYESNEYNQRCVSLNNSLNELNYLRQKLKEDLKNRQEELMHIKNQFAFEKDQFNSHISQFEAIWNQIVNSCDCFENEEFKNSLLNYQIEALKHKIEFVKKVNEFEIDEKKSLTEAFTAGEQINFYKAQLKDIIRQIRFDYDELKLSQLKELQNFMQLQCENFVEKFNIVKCNHSESNVDTENKENVKNEIEMNKKELNALRNHNNMLLKHLEQIEKDSKTKRHSFNDTIKQQSNEEFYLQREISRLSQEKIRFNAQNVKNNSEIQVYRRLLDSQLNKIKYNRQESRELSDISEFIGNFGGKVHNKREKTGNVGIVDASPDGRSLTLSNSSNKLIDLSYWILRRKVGNDFNIEYVLPKGIQIKSKSNLKLLTNRESTTDEDYLVTNLQTWGVGMKSDTCLLNEKFEEKSRLIQTIYFGCD